MSGCSLPVIINAGSGNQGMTCSLPVVEYAKEKGKTEEELLRALCVSNLIAQDQKRYIGALSAYCGVVCACLLYTSQPYDFNEEVIWLFLQLKIRKVEIVVQAINVV